METRVPVQEEAGTWAQFSISKIFSTNPNTVARPCSLHGPAGKKKMYKRNVLLVVLILFVTAFASPGQAQTITTVAGGGPADGANALAANLWQPEQVAIDGAGNMYIAVFHGHRVFRMDASGKLKLVAGTGAPGFSGDGGPAANATLNSPSGVAIDSKGNLLITDAFNNRIRRVDAATGIITTVVGNGSTTAADGVAATSSGLNLTTQPEDWPPPGNVLVDPNDNLFIADTYNSRIRRVDAKTGVITTVAGTGQQGVAGDGGPATQAMLNFPTGVAEDKDGNLFISDTFNQRIRRVDAGTGVITTVAGTGQAGSDSGGYNGDGIPATSARLNRPLAVALDKSGDLFIADSQNYRVRRVDASTGIITTAAGNGSFPPDAGDGGPATSATVAPTSVSVEVMGNLFIADRYNVRRVDSSSQVITSVAGNGTCCFYGDGGPAIDASITPAFAASDGSGNLYIADATNNRVRRVDAATGTTTTVAGNGQTNFCGDYGPATSICLYNPVAVAVDSQGNLFIDDLYHYTIRRVSVGGSSSPVIGFGGQQGPLQYPVSIAVDSKDNLFVADQVRHQVIRVDIATGASSVYAGNGQAGDSGDGGLATSASLIVGGVAVDGTGNLFMSCDGRIRRVDAVTGIITTVAGNGQGGYSGDGGPSLNAGISPTSLTIDSSGDIFFVNEVFEGLLPNAPISTRIRRVDANSGIITTVAGDGNQAYSGDGGPATSASFERILGLDWSEADSGSLLIADFGSFRVRVVTSTGSVPSSSAPSSSTPVPTSSTSRRQKRRGT